MADDLLDLHGRIALVTGAGQGVGRQVALHFARHGAGTVLINDYYPDRAEAVAEEVRNAGAKALALPFDVTDYELSQRSISEAIDDIGRINILVNNAGNAGPQTDFSDTTPFWQTTPEDWAGWIGTNFTGVLNCTRAVLDGMTSNGYGRIVTVISDAGRVGEPNLIVYSGAKAGAAGFTRAIAKAVGRYGVTANCVALSAMRTPSTADAISDPDAAGRMLRGYVVRRFGEPDDAANAVLFLASDAASWITAQTYPVNGGYAVSA